MFAEDYLAVGALTSSGQSTFSLTQISRRRPSVLLTSNGLNLNLEQRDVMGSMILYTTNVAVSLDPVWPAGPVSVRGRNEWRTW